MKKFRNNESRAKWTKTFLILTMIFTGALMVSNYFQLRLIQSWIRGEDVYMLDAEMNDTIQGLISISTLVCMIALLIFFISWFRRAYFNLHQKLKHLNHSEGWAAGAWFVPFLNLYRPYQIAKEIFEESIFYLRTKGIQISDNKNGLLISWWILHLITNFLGRILWKMPEETLEQIEEYTQFALVSGALNFVFFGFSLYLLNTYVEREKLMMEAERNESPTSENLDPLPPNPELSLT